MNKEFGQSNPKIYEYFLKTFEPEDALLNEIRIRCDREGIPAIQVGAGDGRHLEILARMSKAKKIVEIGTLGGYSGVCLLRGMPQDGHLYTFEYEPVHAAAAKLSFEKSGFLNRVDIFVGPAMENLNKINSKGPFDLVFIDADKVNYPNYLTWAYENVPVGGIIVGDNSFAFGMIADENFESIEDEAAVKALREFNSRCAKSGLRGTILPTSEGLTIAVKVK